MGLEISLLPLLSRKAQIGRKPLDPNQGASPVYFCTVLLGEAAFRLLPHALHDLLPSLHDLTSLGNQRGALFGSLFG